MLGSKGRFWGLGLRLRVEGLFAFGFRAWGYRVESRSLGFRVWVLFYPVYVDVFDNHGLTMRLQPPTILLKTLLIAHFMVCGPTPKLNEASPYY